MTEIDKQGSTMFEPENKLFSNTHASSPEAA